MPPYIPDEHKVDEAAWEDGLSNDIYILGKPYKLVKAGDTKVKRVRNFVDDPSIDFEKEAFKRGLAFSPVRKRKGNPQTIEELKKSIQFCVIHTDLAKHARQTFSFLIGAKPTPLSSHFAINWNGVIYQFADVGDRTAHGGETNDISIGIDMNLKMVNLNRPYNREQIQEFNQLRTAYKNLAKEKLQAQFAGLGGRKLAQMLEKYEFERPRQLKLQGSNIRAWGYTPAQYDSLILLLKLFVRELDLEKTYPMTPDGKVIPHLLADEDVKKLKGFIAHWHLSDQRWDPGPGFDWERVLSGLQNEYNWFPLVWDEQMILQGRDLTKASEAAYELMRNTETARQGGTFPIGPNQTWHGGIHLFPPQTGPKEKKLPVHAMFDGVVVAAHFEPNMRPLGHNNFVLLRHEIEVPDRKRKLNEDGTLKTTTLRFYSLYMHLDPMPTTEKGAEQTAGDHEKLTWLKRLYELEKLQEAGQKDKLDQAMKSFEEEIERRREQIQQQLDAGETVAEEYRDLVVDLDAEEVAEMNRDAHFLTVGRGTAALRKADKVALLENEELKVKVSAGEWLGFTGLLPRADGEGYQRGVHVEIFGTEETLNAIDLDLHADHFRTPQRARGSDLTVRTEDILMIFRDAVRYKPYRDVQLWPDERIHPQDIIEFYASGSSGTEDTAEAYREQLRRSITYHVSEWSDQVDWITSLTAGNDWAKEAKSTDFRKLVQREGLFSNEIRKFLPYIWLTAEVAAELGLEGRGKWDGRLYHFHPIHFVMWVTYHAVRRNRVFRTSLSLRDLIARQKRHAATRRLIKEGREAKAQGDREWQRWQASLERELEKKPFRLTRRLRKKRESVQQEYEDVRGRIINGVVGDYQLDDEATLHGVVDAPSPVYSNPDEVLKELYSLPPRREWDVTRINPDEG